MLRTLSLLLAGAALYAQNACDVPLPALGPKEATIFTPAQEEMLGDIAAERYEQQIAIYPRPDLTAHLDKITERLLRSVPGNPHRFRFSLIEIPEANAFALPGGRVYIARRLVAHVENEDELAGVIAHEMGHVLTRQSSIDMTRAFREALKVAEVGDRADIFEKFNRLIESVRQRPESMRRVNQEQVEADRIAVHLAWRAGYDVQALANYFDRFTENKGATGNVFSDLFGFTRPESKRLREMIAETRAIPAACRQARPADDGAAFLAWKKTVAELSREELYAVAKSDLTPALRLSPRLRPELTHLKFSPDGKLLIAQDDAGVNVLRSEPLEHLFRIPALTADNAFFDRDSRRVIIPAAGLRVEIWNLAKRARERLWEPAEFHHCDEVLPSPDGLFAACMAGVGDIRLLEIETNAELARRQFIMDPVALIMNLIAGIAPIDAVHVEFSPDGATFLAGTALTVTGANQWAYDLRKREEFSPGKPLRGSMGGGFSFLSPDRIAAIDPYNNRDSGLYSWPDGKRIEKFSMPPFPVTAATKSPTVFFRPLKDYPVGVMDLTAKEIFQVSRNSPMDRYEDVGVAERLTGEIGLYPGRKTEPIARLQLPEAALGRLRAGVHSPDLTWLALSLKSRGAVWNLRTGKANMYLPFDGGSISNQALWTTTFENWEKKTDGDNFKLAHHRVSIDLNNPNRASAVALPDDENGKTTRFAGNYEVSLEEDKPGKGKTTLAVKDVTAGKELWSRELPGKPRWSVGGALTLEWELKDKAAGQIFDESPELKRKRDALERKDRASLLDVLDLETGRSLGRVLFDVGSTRSPRSIHVAGRTLFLEDHRGRTLAYSLDTGERLGQQFGRALAVNAVRGLVVLESRPGVLVVFDRAMQRLAEYAIPGDVIYAGFDGDGRRLLAVTGGQSVFIQDLPK